MNNLPVATNNILMENYKNTNDITNDVGEIILSAQQTAYKAVDAVLVQRNWLIGRRIAEEELAGKDRADYGVEVIKKLSKELGQQFGKGFAKTNLYSFYLFYKTYPEIFHTACGKSELLSWSHYRLLIHAVSAQRGRTASGDQQAESDFSVAAIGKSCFEGGRGG